MSVESELQAAYDDVLKKIGRNLLMFQQAGEILKLLVAWSNPDSPPDKSAGFAELAELWKQQAIDPQKSCFKERNRTRTGNPPAGFHPDAADIAMSITLGGSDASAGQRRAAIDMLIAERYELVHHLVFKIDRDSLEGCRDISTYLDAQREMCLPAVQQLKDDCERAREMMVGIISCLMADEAVPATGIDPIRHCPLITNLAEIAASKPDPREWTLLNSAICYLQDFPIEKIGDVVAQFGHESLDELLAASRMFDIRNEPFGSGSPRIFYRLRTDTAATNHHP